MKSLGLVTRLNLLSAFSLGFISCLSATCKCTDQILSCLVVILPTRTVRMHLQRTPCRYSNECYLRVLSHSALEIENLTLRRMKLASLIGRAVAQGSAPNMDILFSSVNTLGSESELS